jgi:hypothetical protein
VTASSDAELAWLQPVPTDRRDHFLASVREEVAAGGVERCSHDVAWRECVVGVTGSRLLCHLI